MRDRQCALNHDAIESAAVVSSVINKSTTLSCVYHLSTDDLLRRNFQVHNVEIAHVTLTTPHEAMNGSAKCRKWGGLG